MTKLFPFFLLLANAICFQSACGHTPVDFLEVLQGEPSNLIEHTVEVKSFFDRKKVETQLEGPCKFSLAVGCMGREPKNQKAYLAWYKMVSPTNQAARKVDVLDPIRGSESAPLTIESAEYFLTPAQRITSGPPSQIPDGLDRYKAYRILDAPALELEVKLSEPLGPANRIVGKPVYLCVATEQWHHDEYFPVSHRRACFVVYELDSHEVSQKVSLVDEFGLNQIAAVNSQWLCVNSMLMTFSVD